MWTGLHWLSMRYNGVFINTIIKEPLGRLHNHKEFGDHSAVSSTVQLSRCRLSTRCVCISSFNDAISRFTELVLRELSDEFYNEVQELIQDVDFQT